ncbi:MAG: 1-deoxy-D-xylulose-5-phosphate synthase [Oscillospiraceae bacterium]|nr:1-deoxy-D-xylulose-5-phosphate synthase [Oscillospiraceae bacterium]
MILETIHSPADVKALDKSQLPRLCQELREFLIENVSRTGGHLASNLGAVELTVAIHRVFDTASDRLVFDVGHQCYVHKALTGRQELFSTLRQLDGLSGFPKPYESEHDAFIAGHASNSVSVALGMARGRTLQKKDYSVLALIGDGALTGGLAYEGLNNAGASGEPLIVILNDNGMSINPNVGAMPSHLSRLRSKPAYYHFKKWYRGLFGKHPMENGLYRFNHRVKTALKKALWPGSTLFEDMGFTYLGPIDGHDLPRLCDMLRWAKEQNDPVLVHVHTVKGKGYPYAEQNPGKFHGISPFDPETGLVKKSGGESFSSVFGKALADFAARDPRVCAITAAMADGTGLSGFAKEFPERFFDVAIAEGHGVSMAAGLASQGMIPVFAVYSTFLQRGYDQLIHDVALERLHVVFGVDRAGLVGPDGETHHGCFDPLFLCTIPSFTVLCPSNFAELRSMLKRAVFDLDSPVAVRYPRGGEGTFREDLSAEPAARLRQGSDVTLLGYGVLVNHLLEAAELLAEKGIQAEVLKLNQISPLDHGTVCAALGGRKTLLVLEDSFGAGCVGQRVAAILAEHGQAPEQLILKNLGKTFAPEGSVTELEHRFDLDAAGVAAAAEEAVKHGK